MLKSSLMKSFRNLAIIAIIVVLSGCGETRMKHWHSAKELRDSSEERLPLTGLPLSSKNITFIWNIDTNEAWEFYETLPEEVKTVTKDCHKVVGEVVDLPRQPRRHVFFTISGWPEHLTANGSAFNEYTIFRCDEPPPYQAWKGPNYYWIAINGSKDKVFAWNNDGG